jgi:hypothetical protein
MLDNLVGMIWCQRVVQFLITEVASCCFFFAASSRLGKELALRWGITAPITLILIPVWAFSERDYLGMIEFASLDAGFAIVLIVLILRKRARLSGIVLLLFNLLGFALSLNY